MQLHPNAKLTPASRRLLVRRVREEKRSVTEAAAAAGVSRPTAHKWLHRFDSEGESGLEDRSSRPRSIPIQVSKRLVRRIEQLRRRRRTAQEISLETGIPASTVSKHLKAQGLGRIWRMDEELRPPQRYELPHPGDLLHIDAKRFVKIDGVGHAIHGNRRKKARGIGWEVAFVCVDDHTRLAYAEILPSENAKYATAFLRRALRWYESLGIRCKRILSDNAKCYGSNAFTALCEEKDIRQSFTRPYTPKTNGKAERFIQTLKRRWAYRHTYRTSAIRAASLPAWVKHYNHKRPHRSLGKKTPMRRLRESRQQRV